MSFVQGVASLVEGFQELVLAKLERRVQALKILNVIGTTKQADIVQTLAYVGRRSESTHYHPDPLSAQYSVDARERFCGREINAVDTGNIEDEKLNWWRVRKLISKQGFDPVFHANDCAKLEPRSVPYATNMRRTHEKITCKSHQVYLPPNLFKEGSLDRVPSNR